jgi:catechol 2,3-dioxygenase-like lactoylglutathione lyase family enzyme
MTIRVQRLQHVSVPRPPGPEAHKRSVAFYCGLLGLEEVPKPRTFTEIDVTWFRIGDCEIHVFAAEPNAGMVHPGSHFCLVAEDLAATRAGLEAAGYETHDTAPIPNRPRFNVRDPFGNLIELTHIEGNYLADP